MLKAVLLLSTFAVWCEPSAAADKCYDVYTGDFYPTPPVPFEFDNSTLRSTVVTFRPNAASYVCTGCAAEAICQPNWNKLWGKGRCGFLTAHHIDSDRFAWRRHLTLDNLIEIAAYSYDNGTKPYPDDPTLLKRFTTLLTPNVRYTLRTQSFVNATAFLLLDESGQKLIEQRVVVHAHQCKQFNEGYRLGLYFGGGCPAPQDVTVCYDS